MSTNPDTPTAETATEPEEAWQQSRKLTIFYEAESESEDDAIYDALIDSACDILDTCHYGDETFQCAVGEPADYQNKHPVEHPTEAQIQAALDKIHTHPSEESDRDIHR